jgi:2-haloacid dehalogenase
VLVFDVNETLSDMRPLAARFEQVGAPGHLADTWFAAVLRDGFALAVAGTSAPFADVASAVLRSVLSKAGVDDVTAGIDHVMRGFSELGVHDDVPEGLRRLHEAGYRLVTLTNGSKQVPETLLQRAGLRELFERLMSVEDAELWKPARVAYQHAVRLCGVPAGELMLVAVHPWDVDGARRAGLGGVWINRSNLPYPAFATPPDVTAGSLVELVDALSGR